MRRLLTILTVLALILGLAYGPELREPVEIPKIETSKARGILSSEQWRMIVDKISIDLGLTSDRELAELIAHSIENYSNEFDVNPWLMVSLIRVESTGNPMAISRVGARGLTQIMPATGREIARDLGVEWEGVEMLHGPETSVRFGAYYLSKLLARFDGNKHAAVAAYNWGPHHIAKRLRNGETLPVVYATKVLTRLN